MSKYAALLKELQNVDSTLAKAMPADSGDDDTDEGEGDDAGKKTKATAKDGDAEGDEKIQDAADDAEGDDGKKKETVCKSFTITDKEGKEHEAIDASEILAPMQADQEVLGKSLQATVNVLGRLAKGHQALAKALSTLTETNEKVVKQNEELKKSLDAIGDKGRGRKSTVLVTGADEKNKPGDGMSPEVFMAKADLAISKNLISAVEASMLEGAMQRGQQPPADIVAKVLAA